MTYLVAGMSRSGSTWLFNAARLLLQHAGADDLRAGWVADADQLLAGRNALIKVHIFDARLAGRADIVLTSHRDLRDALASYRRKFKQEPTAKLARFIFDEYSKWARSAAYDMHYERMMADKLGELRRIAVALRLEAELPYEQILAEIEALQFRPQAATGEGYDAASLLHEGHITDGRQGTWHDIVPADVITQIEREFGDWLKQRGYKVG